MGFDQSEHVQQGEMKMKRWGCPLGKLLLEVTSLKVWGASPKIKNNQIYLIMQNAGNDSKHRYKLILRGILIIECDFRFNFNLKLNNVTETTGQIISTCIFLGATDWAILNSIKLPSYYLIIRVLRRLSFVQSVALRQIREEIIWSEQICLLSGHSCMPMAVSRMWLVS